MSSIDAIPCEPIVYLSCVCERGTKGCNVRHSERRPPELYASEDEHRVLRILQAVSRGERIAARVAKAASDAVLEAYQEVYGDE